MIRRAETHTLSSQITDASKDNKKLFNLINTMTDSGKSNPLPPSTSDEELTEEFAIFFMNNSKKSGMHLILILNLSLLNKTPASPMITVTCLLKMKLKKSLCPFPPNPLNWMYCQPKCIEEIIKIFFSLLTKIINLSLSEGLFVEEWKVAIIHPLLKKLGLDLISKNYRPVSNLPFLSKVVEKCALKQFIKHCDENSLLPTYQSAYRKNYSCETTLVKLFDDLLWLMEQQKVNLLVVIDLSATFDTVDHGILIDVLNTAFNVGGKSLNWFKSYLYPRSSKVNIGKCFSSNQDLCFSVPQRSLCGPVLYNAYASTMNTVVPPSIAIHAYVDEHALKKELNSSIPQEEVETAKSLSNCLDKVKDWMNSCHLR